MGFSGYIDSHAHLTSDQIYGDIESILSRAQERHVIGIVNICTNVETLLRGLKVSEQHPWVYQAAATTPHDVEKEGEEAFPVIEEKIRSGKLVAVGETGLDYFYEHSDRNTQKKFLRRYLHLALECKLPVIIHCREAFSDFFEILDSEYCVDGKQASGVLHCFTGTVEEAYQVLKRGWYLSLSGIVTFKKSEVLREVARLVPLEQLLIETDSPYLAPQSKRGKLNEPSFLPEVAAVIAEAKGIPAEAVAQASMSNAKKLFRI